MMLSGCINETFWLEGFKYLCIEVALLETQNCIIMLIMHNDVGCVLYDLVENNECVSKNKHGHTYTATH